MPGPIPPFPWRLTDGDDVDFTFHVAGTPQWRRPEESRLAASPTGGPPTLLTVTSAVQPRQFRVAVRILPSPTRNAEMATLESLWAARGPYTLTAPIFPAPFLVILDASQGGLEWTPEGDGARTAVVGFQEWA